MSDLNKIEKILKKMPLQDECARRSLAHLLYDRRIFHHTVGVLFLKTLVKGEAYRTPEEQAAVWKDCECFRKLAETAAGGTLNQVEELEDRLQKQAVHFQSWIKSPAYRYLPQLSKEHERQLIREEKQHQMEDLRRIGIFAENIRLDKQAGLDNLYRSLQVHGKPVFESWIGEDFAAMLQKRTSFYQRKQKIKKIALIAAVLSLAAALGFSGKLIKNKEDQERAKWKQQLLDEIRMGETETVKGAETVKEDTALVGTSGVDDGNNGEDILPEYRLLHEKNPDLAGWLLMSGLDISLPVMQRREDEEFYLTHGFDGQAAEEGALFIDAITSVRPMSRNIVIYGHHMSNGDMFGNLEKYCDKEFWSKNRQFQFDTIYEKGTYEVIAAIRTRILRKGEEGFRYYRFHDYSRPEEFQKAADFIKSQSLYDTGAELKYGDDFIMLSTCEYSREEGRLVIVGRLDTAYQ